jgi:hypothetical protein
MRIGTLLCLYIGAASAYALDANCELAIKASENRIQQPAWHSIAETDGLKMEAIKLDGKFYNNVGGKWVAFPINLDDAERTLLAQFRNGKAKISNCKQIKNDTVDGVPVVVIATRTELKGVPPADAQLYIGKDDGLPYQQTGTNFKVVYQYKNIVAPKL